MSQIYKIYREGNYIRVVDVLTNELFNGAVKDVFIDKSNVQKNEYTISKIKDFDETNTLSIGKILKSDDTAYSISEWETFYTENTGNFNGGGAAPETLENKVNIYTVDGTGEKYYTADYINETTTQIEQDIQAQLVDSTIINGVTTSSSVPPTGNIHAIGVGAGTYPNWGGMVIPSNNIGTLSRVSGTYSVSLTAFSDVNKIRPWVAGTYASGSQVNYLGKDWYLPTSAALSTDVPGTSAKWVERLTGYNAVTEIDTTSLVNLAGYIDKTGVFVSDTNWLSSNYLDCVSTDIFNLDVFGHTVINSISFYDINKTFISGSGLVTSNPYKLRTVPPTNGVFYRLSFGKTPFSGYASKTTILYNAIDKIDKLNTNSDANRYNINNIVTEKDLTLSDVVYPSKPFSEMTSSVGDLGTTYYVNYETKVINHLIIKNFSLKTTGSGTAYIKAIDIVSDNGGGNFTVATLHEYTPVSVTAGTNTYTISDDFIIPTGAYLAVKCSVLYYNAGNTSLYPNNSFRLSNDITGLSSKVRVSFNYTSFGMRVARDILTKSYADTLYLKSNLDGANYRFPKKQVLNSSSKIILYGDSISSTDYPWYKSSMELITGAQVYNGGFSGANAAALAKNTALQRIFDYNPNVIISLIGGNDSGAAGTIGTFTNINGEPLVTETSILSDYSGTYYIQAISHIIRKIKAQYYNIRANANLLGTETEAEKTTKIDAVLKPYFVFCTTLKQKRNNSTDANSLDVNWKRKRDAVLECCIKYNVHCIDLPNVLAWDMSLEPYWVSPTDKVTNNGIYMMDGLHPNKYGFRQMSEVICSEIL